MYGEPFIFILIHFVNFSLLRPFLYANSPLKGSKGYSLFIHILTPPKGSSPHQTSPLFWIWSVLF